jgi:hypothetical protein
MISNSNYIECGNNSNIIISSSFLPSTTITSSANNTFKISNNTDQKICLTPFFNNGNFSTSKILEPGADYTLDKNSIGTISKIVISPCSGIKKDFIIVDETTNTPLAISTDYRIDIDVNKLFENSVFNISIQNKSNITSNFTIKNKNLYLISYFYYNKNPMILKEGESVSLTIDTLITNLTITSGTGISFNVEISYINGIIDTIKSSNINGVYTITFDIQKYYNYNNLLIEAVKS